MLLIVVYVSGHVATHAFPNRTIPVTQDEHVVVLVTQLPQEPPHGLHVLAMFTNPPLHALTHYDA